MQTILVPVDFSETAINAAKYGFQLAKQTNARKLVLLNVCTLPSMADGGLSIPVTANIDEIKKNSLASLQLIQEQLEQEFNDILIPIEVTCIYNNLLAGIQEVIEQHKISLLVMGITGGGALQEAFIGSNTIDIANEIKVPVLIIPKQATFKPLRNVFMTCSMENIYDKMPIEKIQAFLNDTKTNFNVLHVEKINNNESFEGTHFESMALNTLFAEYNPTYHFTGNVNFIDGVNDFVEKNSVDVLIVLPKKHSLFDSLFNKSHTKMLAFHSHVPVLVVHN